MTKNFNFKNIIFYDPDDKGEGCRAMIDFENAAGLDTVDEEMLLRYLAMQLLGDILFASDKVKSLVVLNNILIDCPMEVLGKFFLFEIADGASGKSVSIGTPEEIQNDDLIELSKLSGCIIYSARFKKIT